MAVRVNVPAGYAGDGWSSGSWSTRSGNALSLVVDLLGRAMASACTLCGVGEVQVQNEQHKLKGTVWPEADEAAFKAKITHRQEALRTPAPAFSALPLRPRIATDTADIPNPPPAPPVLPPFTRKSTQTRPCLCLLDTSSCPKLRDVSRWKWRPPCDADGARLSTLESSGTRRRGTHTSHRHACGTTVSFCPATRAG